MSKVKDVLVNHRAELVLEHSFLAGLRSQAGAADTELCDNVAVVKGGLADVGFAADDEDDPRGGRTHTTKLVQHVGDVKAILLDCEKPIAAVFAVGANLGASDVQRVPTERFHWRTILLVVVKDVNVRRRGDDEVDLCVSQRQASCVAIGDSYLGPRTW